MNICLLNDSFPPVIDGVANVVMNYGRIMQTELNANVVVATPRYPDTDYDCYPYKVVAYPSLDTSKIVSGYRAGNPLAMKEIEKMSEFAPDIIHAHCPASSMFMARILQNETGAPIIFTYHTKFDVDIARAVGEGFLKKETVKAMVSNISAADEVWVVSKGAGENLKSLGYEGDYRVVSNGVDFARGRAEQSAVKEATKAYDLPEDVPMFLFVGRLMKYKGLMLIVDAMKILKDSGMDFRMVFVGGGADEEEMKNAVREKGLEGKVFFTGAIHDREVLRAWNTRADLFLFPSSYDTNGIVVREAAACGLASVLIKDSCAAEGITPGRNGFVIEENAQAMAELLKEVCKDMDHVHETGRKAMEEIYISWEGSVRDAYARYEEISAMVKSGELKRRKPHASDIVLEAAANVAEAGRKVFDIPAVLFEGMMENVSELQELGQQTKENIKQGLKKAGETIEQGVENIKNLPKGK
ncbi:MAG: glycosyltransferase [Lachnospiraceae bacterium]|nr:glycosyltransferase [Lachnospiraceae bacterium]